MNHWLLKSEPDVFSLTDLANRPGQTDYWNGVRNYQARNFIRDVMRPGDAVLFYHSNCAQPGIVGLAKITSHSYPDPTAFDPESEYHDAKSTPDNPRWYVVDVQFVEHFTTPVTLQFIKEDPELSTMLVARKGQRLSVQPVEPAHYQRVVNLGKQ